MVKKIVEYQCEKTKKKFNTEKAAKASEDKFALDKEVKQKIKIFETIYKQTHPKDDYLIRHCVDCGKKVLEWDSAWDGHRTERGEVKFREPDYDVFLGGRRCKDCHKKIYLKLVDAVFFYQEAEIHKGKLNIKSN